MTESKTYEGRPCGKCGSAKRYKRWHNCKSCSDERNRFYRNTKTKCYKCGADNKTKSVWCRKCVREWEGRNEYEPGGYQKSKILAKYGMSIDDYNTILSQQGQLCGICSGNCPTGRRLAVDHCHKSQKVRGLLCVNCNLGLGSFKDDPTLLTAAIAYLERHRYD